MTIQEQMWRVLRGEVERVDTRISRQENRSARAETAGGVPASTLAAAPLAIDGGMSDGMYYIDLRWISDGRRPGEEVGMGSGVLAFYNKATDQWYGVHDYQAVQV